MTAGGLSLRFEPDQPHQRAALDALTQLFDGHWRDNLASVQRAGGLRVDQPREPRFSVEMETGTGKTYVMLRAMHELHRRRGWRHFVLVVPGVAVREGALTSWQAMAPHFAELYGAEPRSCIAYRSDQRSRLREFTEAPHLTLLVLNIDAFRGRSTLARRADERVFGGESALEQLARVRPVVFVDEPQRMGSELSRQAIEALAPRAELHFSATLRERHHLVHRLGPGQAYGAGLVKRIEVDSVDGGVAARVRAAIRRHLERERAIAQRGVSMKVLTLFFVDRVADYAEPDGVARRAFEEAYRELAAEFGDERGVGDAHGGYFARARSGRRAGQWKDSRQPGKAEDEAFELIMRDKARLLSPDEPLRFLFSHSALREGWDNPNVFQICSLNRAKGARRRRQEIGRGLRLPVMADGARRRDPDLAVLTVVAAEPYADFAAALQAEVPELPPRAVRSAADKVDVAMRPGWLEDAALARLWAAVARPLSWQVGPMGLEPLVEALRGLPPIAAARRRSARLGQDGRWSTTAQAALDVSVPDLLVTLGQGAGLRRATLARALRASGRLGEAAAHPEAFVLAAIPALRTAQERRLAEATTFEAVGVAPPLDALQTWALPRHPDRLLPGERTPWTQLPAGRDRAFVQTLLDGPDVQRVLRLPPGYAVATPAGPVPLRWAWLRDRPHVRVRGPFAPAIARALGVEVG